MGGIWISWTIFHIKRADDLKTGRPPAFFWKILGVRKFRVSLYN